MTTVPGDGIYVRRNIWELSSEEEPWHPIVLAYARAVVEMQDRRPDNPTSWTYQANMHNTYDPGEAPHWKQCPHGTWFFLPWHRIYLYWFERIARSIVAQDQGLADWALPYWNYSDEAEQAKLPPAFRQPRLPDGTENPLYLPFPLRTEWMSQGNPLPEEAVSYAAAFEQQEFTDEAGFGELIEGTPHGDIHMQVGGTRNGTTCGNAMMSRFQCAARDPIFWLHHCNIDRLWKAWLRREEGRANPSDADWLKETYFMFDEVGNEAKMSVADVLDEVSQLGYRYDDDPPETRALTAPVAVQAVSGRASATVLGATAGPRLRGRRVTVSADLSTAVADASRPAVPTGRRRILRLEGIQFPDSAGIPYAVFLNLPDDDSEASHLSAHYVGTLALFGDTGEVHHGGHETGIRRSYDISKVVERLEGEGRWDATKVTVTFVPRPQPGTDHAEVEALPEVRIGRVSVASS